MTQPRYRLTGRLETGELAELYTGVRDDRDPVVIKLFHPRTSDERYARVLADVAGKVEQAGAGEGLIRTLDMGMIRGRLALVREHVMGQTLGQGLQRLVTREVLLAPPLALYLVIQLLDAVQKAHDAGAVHGAITPGNVLLGADGRVSLADFGALAALTAVPALRPYAVKGRGTYRAPETAQGEPPTTASDLYSLGAIAYELLTLREPSRGKAVSTRNEALTPPSRLDRRINARLDPMILRALEAQPGRRFKSCQELSSALRNFLGASGGMPSRADLAKVVGDLFPGDGAPQPSKELPFAEAFTLEAVEGAQIEPGAAAPIPSVLMPRPSFSGGGFPAVASDGAPGGAETVEGMPAFADHPAPEPTHVPGRPAVEPTFEDGTAPGAAGPLELGWVAPPGAAPAKKRAPAGLGGGMVTGPRSAAMKGRYKVMEDLSAPAEPTDPEAQGSARPPRARQVTPPPEPVREPRPLQHSDPGVSSSQIDVPLVKEPDGRKRRMFTEEVNLFRAGQKRRRYLAVAGAVALVGAFCFALVVWRFSTAAPQAGPPATPGDPFADTQPATAPPPSEPAPANPSTGEQAAVRIEPQEEPAPAGGTAFLTLTSNVRARVYLNGKALRGTTPIRRHRVEPGTHKIAVVAVKGGERREFTKRFEAGESVTLNERFTPPGKRR